MEFNYKPRDIQIYCDFPVQYGEVTISFENDESEIIHIYTRVLIRDSAMLPVAEGRFNETREDTRKYVILEPGKKCEASLVIDKENLKKLAHGQEYTALIQYGVPQDFAWTDTMLANLDVFQNWDETPNPLLLDEIACMLPVKFETVQFHVRKMLDDAHLDLCMDFGTSFSACAISIDPAKNRSLACFRSTDKPRPIYYTQFQAEDGSEKSIVPSVMVLYKIGDGDSSSWLHGFNAMAWAKKNPKKGSFVTDIKRLLLNLDEKRSYFDINGQKREFSNEEVVRTYLKYLVEKSKRYFGVDFRSVHITTPVAYPDRQRRAYERILTGLGFTRIKNKLDEARAPLYHFLSSKVEKNRNAEKDENARNLDNKSLSYLIIDCGGGSTDATLLRNIRLAPPNKPGGGIVMSTDEPQKGGNPNFGGSDLTKLLFHYLKMRVCEVVTSEFQKLDASLAENKDYLIDKIIETQEQNIFWELYQKEVQMQSDGDNKDELIPRAQHEQAYGRFEEIAKKVEELFPTDEEHNGDMDRNTWERIHSNKSTVWQLAELLKVNIFATDAPRKINLLDLPDAPKLEFWLRDSATVELQPVDAVALGGQLDFHTYELNKLFRPIIFKEIARIKRQLNIQTDLSGETTFFNVRFVGQSTNIPLFNEALAYFVPRSMIEEEDRNFQEKGSSRFQLIPAEEKKICCVTGAANFLKHIARGYLKEELFVASTRVLKNFCRFDSNSQPTRAGVYDVHCQPADHLIARNTPLAEARGVVIRALAEQMEEFFGTTYDEDVTLEGWLDFQREDMSHPLSDAEKEAVESRWHDLFHNLNTDEGDLVVLLQVELLEDGAAQRYEFRPYYWNPQEDRFFTTPQPLQMRFVEQG